MKGTHSALIVRIMALLLIFLSTSSVADEKHYALNGPNYNKDFHKILHDEKFRKWGKGIPNNLREIERVFGGRIRMVSKQNGIDPKLTAAIIAVESSGKPKLCSRSEACGLMQLKRIVAKELKFKGNITQPWNNIWLGTKYLTTLRDRYGFTTIEWQLYAFNQGPTKAREMLRNGYKPSKDNYVKKVLFALQAINEEGQLIILAKQ
ncbi:transglycosylase SLT domain-containing protein [Patescibacteria group bacterium]|nr:transglycosylase SLT domain-containing protein [Patescibacteria group bacterium]